MVYKIYFTYEIYTHQVIIHHYEKSDGITYSYMFKTYGFFTYNTYNNVSAELSKYIKAEKVITGVINIEKSNNKIAKRYRDAFLSHLRNINIDSILDGIL